jgi:hypothetical protein
MWQALPAAGATACQQTIERCYNEAKCQPTRVARSPHHTIAAFLSAAAWKGAFTH